MNKKTLFLSLIVLSFASIGRAEEEEILVSEVDSVPSTTQVDDLTLIAAADNLGPTATGFQSDRAGPRADNFFDPKVLRDFVESKGLISCRQKEGSLMIYGDVRARWIAAGEEVNGIKQRGQGTKTAIDRFKSEVSLYFDYVAPRSWITTKLRYSNFDGRDGGTSSRIDMERAFIGYDIYSQGNQDFYIEIGRSNLDYMYESKLQFASIFDGIHFFYTQEWPYIGDFTIHGGPFIVDSFTNHYAWIVETYITNWIKSGISFKYSIVDWHRFAPTLNYGDLPNAGKEKIANNPRYRFVISQMLIGYEQEIDFAKCKTLFLYGAGLINHAAQPVPQTNYRKLNRAWYVGFTLGKLCKACDWSIDINYQNVQAQAVPEFDLNGIGHGNAVGGFLSDGIILNLPVSDVRMFTNYKGWEVNGLYAMTDALSLRARAQYSVPRNKGIGYDNFHYKTFEMGVIYAF